MSRNVVAPPVMSTHIAEALPTTEPKQVADVGLLQGANSSQIGARREQPPSIHAEWMARSLVLASSTNVVHPPGQEISWGIEHPQEARELRTHVLAVGISAS